MRVDLQVHQKVVHHHFIHQGYPGENKAAHGNCERREVSVWPAREIEYVCCVCMCGYRCVCVRVWVQVCVCMCVCMCEYRCVCAYVCACVDTGVCVHMCVCACVGTGVCVHMCVCMCARMCMHAHSVGVGVGVCVWGGVHMSVSEGNMCMCVV